MDLEYGFIMNWKDKFIVYAYSNLANDIGSISCSEAYSIANGLFLQCGKDIKSELPHFKSNYNMIQSMHNSSPKKSKGVPQDSEFEILNAITAKELRPSQESIFLSKVINDILSKGVDAIYDGDPIYITKDKYIIDGHHRWAEAMLIDPAIELSNLRVISDDYKNLPLFVRPNDGNIRDEG